jgi:hypothetical protein
VAVGDVKARRRLNAMPLLLLLTLVVTVATVVGLVTWRYPRATAPTPNSTIATAREVG